MATISRLTLILKDYLYTVLPSADDILFSVAIIALIAKDMMMKHLENKGIMKCFLIFYERRE